jgi:hypothetical protein
MEKYSTANLENLRKLQKWLDFEISSSPMIFFSWFWGILLFLTAILAVIFIPFMLKVLYQEKKFSWIIYFAILVLIPAITLNLITMDTNFRFFASAIPLALFFFYCFTLKLAVRNWVVDRLYINGNISSQIETDNYLNKF